MLPSYQISLYLKGSSLQHADITALLGVAPTSAHLMGDKKRLASGREVTRRTGLWALTVRDDQGSDFSALVHSLVDKFHTFGQSFTQLPGVEEAFVDVLVMRSANKDGGGTNEFWINGEALKSLCNLGLPLQITAAVIPQQCEQ